MFPVSVVLYSKPTCCTETAENERCWVGQKVHLGQGLFSKVFDIRFVLRVSVSLVSSVHYRSCDESRADGLTLVCCFFGLAFSFSSALGHNKVIINCLLGRMLECKCCWTTF